ncbi:MAG: alpha/beta hydrolase [Ruminococcaceae bacterium]|nr:alpha/beta hydrolase [Oscillospiraceae bacterium]
MKCERIYLKDVYEFLGADNANPTLDVYIPDDASESKNAKPCMIVCPGGGYAYCSPREAEPIALKFVSEGFNTFVLTYSTESYRFPTQIREVAAAVEILYKNKEAWNCDISKICIIGFSAGGHLAAHYSTMFDCKEVRAVFENSKPVNACVLCYPVISADLEVAHQGSFLNLIGHAPENQKEEDYFSCDKQVSDKTPPTFIWSTSFDEIVPIENSLRYATALSRHKIPYELHIYPYGNHGLATCDKMTNDQITEVIEYAKPWIDEVKKWLRLVL